MLKGRPTPMPHGRTTETHRLFIEAFMSSRFKQRYLAKGFIPDDDVYHRLATTIDQRWVVSLIGPWSLTMNVLALFTRLGVASVVELLPRLPDEPEVTPVGALREGAFNFSAELYWLQPGDLAYYVSEAMPGHCDRWLLIRDSKLREQARRFIESSPG